MEKVFLVMPAYNEEANIEATLRQWHPVAAWLAEMGAEAHILVANDGSTDGTLAVLRRLASSGCFPRLEVVDKPNSGHGATVRSLYARALAEGADFVFQTDSDGQTDPDQFWPLWERRADYDFQIGSRLGRQDGAGRVFVTRVLRLVVWATFGVWVADANTPFRLMRAEALREVLGVVPADFFLCNVAVAAVAVKWRKRVRFVPITFRPRQGGVNSINMRRIVKIGLKAVGDFVSINRKLGRYGK